MPHKISPPTPSHSSSHLPLSLLPSHNAELSFHYFYHLSSSIQLLVHLACRYWKYPNITSHMSSRNINNLNATALHFCPKYTVITFGSEILDIKGTPDAS